MNAGKIGRIILGAATAVALTCAVSCNQQGDSLNTTQMQTQNCLAVFNACNIGCSQAQDDNQRAICVSQCSVGLNACYQTVPGIQTSSASK